MIVVIWRAGLRVGEALTLVESDLDLGRGSILVRHGKGDKRREVGMDEWAWSQLAHVARAAPGVSGWAAVLRCRGTDGWRTMVD